MSEVKLTKLNRKQSKALRNAYMNIRRAPICEIAFELFLMNHRIPAWLAHFIAKGSSKWILKWGFVKELMANDRQAKPL